MSTEVVLSAALRNNLLSLQRTQSNIDKAQQILSTGLRVSSALDNPQNFFASQSLKNRSTDLSRMLDGIGQSIQTIKTADAGVTGLTKLVNQADSLVQSAREAITDGQIQASVTGNTKLSGVQDLTTLSGVTNTDAIEFVIKNKDGVQLTLSAASISIATGDSIEQLITKINDITDNTGATSATNGEELIKAELDSEGRLSLTALNGFTLNVTFNASTGTAGGGEDQALASALGFSNLAKVTTSGAATAAVEFTAIPTLKLESGTFYTATTGAYASASTLLTATRTTDGGATARFATATTSEIDITVNDKTTVSIAFDATTTVQHIVDGINTNPSLNKLLKASYDETTGKLSIEAASSEVSTVRIAVDETAGNTAVADFDFGVDTQFAAGAAAGTEGETFIFATAAATLARLESDYDTVLQQIDELVLDANYRGVNLLNGDDLTTFMNEDRTNKLVTKGQVLSAAGLGIADADFSTLTKIEASQTEVLAAKETLRGFGSTIANSLSIIQTRQEFSTSLIEFLNEGSDKLVAADQNEEGAKLLALQTRQQLGVTALSLAAQSQQSVLRLF